MAYAIEQDERNKFEKFAGNLQLCQTNLKRFIANITLLTLKSQASLVI